MARGIKGGVQAFAHLPAFASRRVGHASQTFPLLAIYRMWACPHPGGEHKSRRLRRERCIDMQTPRRPHARSQRKSHDMQTKSVHARATAQPSVLLVKGGMKCLSALVLKTSNLSRRHSWPESPKRIKMRDTSESLSLDKKPRGISGHVICPVSKSQNLQPRRCKDGASQPRLEACLLLPTKNPTLPENVHFFIRSAPAPLDQSAPSVHPHRRKQVLVPYQPEAPGQRLHPWIMKGTLEDAIGRSGDVNFNQISDWGQSREGLFLSRG